MNRIYPDFEKEYMHMAKINERRKVARSRPWFPSRYQEYLDGRPLWEHIFNKKYTGREKMHVIEDMYDDHMQIINILKKDKVYKKRASTVEKFFEQGLQSAYLDPRLTPIIVNERPSWFNVPLRTKALLSRAGRAVFSTPAVTAAITTAVLASTPEIGAYLDEFSPILKDRVVFTGSTIAPALMFLWKYWRFHVTRAQKLRIKKIKEQKMKLEALRSVRESRNLNAIHDAKIMILEKELQFEMNVAFSKAFTHALPTNNI